MPSVPPAKGTRLKYLLGPVAVFAGGFALPTVAFRAAELGIGRLPSAAVACFEQLPFEAQVLIGLGAVVGGALLFPLRRRAGNRD